MKFSIQEAGSVPPLCAGSRAQAWPIQVLRSQLPSLHRDWSPHISQVLKAEMWLHTRAAWNTQLCRAFRNLDGPSQALQPGQGPRQHHPAREGPWGDPKSRCTNRRLRKAGKGLPEHRFQPGNEHLVNSTEHQVPLKGWGSQTSLGSPFQA